MLEQYFYTLLLGMSKEIGILVPTGALKYLDASVDVNSLLQKAEDEDSAFNVQNDYGEDDYGSGDDDNGNYDEWDRPEITEVKRLQLEKRKSNLPVKSHSILNHKIDSQAPLIDYLKAQQLMRYVLDKCVQILQEMNQEQFNNEVMLAIFNMVMSLCTNLGNVSAYNL